MLVGGLFYILLFYSWRIKLVESSILVLLGSTHSKHQMVGFDLYHSHTSTTAIKTSVMSTRKRKQRIEETSELFTSSVDDANVRKLLKTKADDELFFVDKTGSKNAKRKVLKEVAEKTEGRKQPAAIVKTKIKANAKRVALALAEKQEAAKTVSVHDLWGDMECVDKQPTRKKEIKTKIAIPGMSYNPSLDDHQDALAEGLALEVDKVEKEKKKNQRLEDSSTMSELTLSLMNTADSEEEEDDDEDDEANPTGHRLSRRLRSKFTKAQRNKLRARKESDYEQKKAKLGAKLLKSINTVPHLLKVLDSEKELKENRKAVKDAYEKERLEQEEHMRTTGLSYEEAGAIPLSDELQGTLRQMKPKGVLINEEVSKLRNSGEVMKRDRRKRRAYEKPHADKKVKWVARHKYV